MEDELSAADGAVRTDRSRHRAPRRCAGASARVASLIASAPVPSEPPVATCRRHSGRAQTEASPLPFRCRSRMPRRGGGSSIGIRRRGIAGCAGLDIVPRRRTVAPPGAADARRAAARSRDHHHDGERVDRLVVAAGRLAQVRDQNRRRDGAGAPGQQDPSVDAAHVARAEEVGGERRHRAEAAAVAEADDRECGAEQRQVASGCGSMKKIDRLNDVQQQVDARAADVVRHPGPEHAAGAVEDRDEARPCRRRQSASCRPSAAPSAMPG